MNARKQHTGSNTGGVSTERAWDFLLQLGALAKSGRAIGSQRGDAQLEAGSPILIDLKAERLWRLAPGSTICAEAHQMLDLYMPLCAGEEANSLVTAHLGQSLDGRIATLGGASQFITGQENLIHTHRMRALFSAVLVGARTALHDNPKLTTRLTPGEHATRVLIDPRCSADREASLFVDGMAETVVVCARSALPNEQETAHGSTRYVGLDSSDGVLAPRDILSALRALGLRRIFIEGGGVTVSQFLAAGALGRLHICVAPMIIGSGRPSMALPEVEQLGDSHFLTVRHFASGKDLLFDCQLLDCQPREKE